MYNNRDSIPDRSKPLLGEERFIVEELERSFSLIHNECAVCGLRSVCEGLSQAR